LCASALLAKGSFVRKTSVSKNLTFVHESAEKGVIMKKYMCILMVFVASVMSTTAFGALDQSNLSWGTTVNPTSTSWFMGQTFIQGAGLTSLDQVNFKYYAYEAGGPTYTSVVELHNYHLDTYNASTLIATSSPTTPASFAFDADPATGHIWYDFAGGAAVTPGTIYAIILKHTSGHWAPALDGGANYADGAYINNYNGIGGNGFTTVFHQDMSFQTFSTPEPATMSLLGLGGIALLRKRRA
jgi:hypothetical protein